MTTLGPGPSAILVVDDNAQNRALAQGILEAADYRVRLAASGAEALEVFVSMKPDLILLDVLMPKMDGFETCRRLRGMPGVGAEVPIVFLTAQTDLLSHQRALESGADDFLTKPINRVELIIRVRSLIRIRRLQEKLAEAARNKQELTDLIVHDLKNPIATVLVNAGYALGCSTLSEDQWAALHDVVATAHTMNRMVMNLLDISASEDGSLKTSVSSTDLSALVEQVRGTMARRAVLEQRQLAVEGPTSSVVAPVDPDLLRRILENLVDNCLKYTPRGSSVSIVLERTDTSVRIRVKDQGAGVPTGERERIFEKYAQIEGGPSSARSSRGLGLRFCKLAAEAHGGRIWVEDNEPRGSAFVLALPT
ncbi:MAG TPA: hybrid sensor histidine kinase/response regulator [Polyangiaceae bacterium]